MIKEEYPWTNAEVRLFQFVPDQVGHDECPLFHVKDIAAGGQTDAELEADAGQDVYPANSAPTFPTAAGKGKSRAGDASGAHPALASMEERVKQMCVGVLTIQPSISGIAGKRAGGPGPPPGRGRGEEGGSRKAGVASFADYRDCLEIYDYNPRRGGEAVQTV